MVTATRQRTVRVTEATHQLLRELTRQSGEPMTVMLERAVEQYRRERLLAEADEAWAALRADPAALRDVEAEQALWDRALADGLEPEEW